MKTLIYAITLLLSLSLHAQTNIVEDRDGGHGGGNGGDDLELELKKRSIQIGFFIKSDMGSKIFKMLNADSIVDMTNTMDIDVVSGTVTDKYGTVRTCVNEPDRGLVTCNATKINDLRLRKSEDILTAVLFHEILGLMNLELGYQENVSLYPISSKIIPYNDIVMSTPISEGQIRPEFYGLDNRSYGLVLINKETQESIRMICLNNNVEIHRCRNYSIVRNANGLQAPLLPEIVSLSKADLAQIQAIVSDLEDLKDKKVVITSKGFKFISINSRYMYNHNGRTEYRFGAGCSQRNSYTGGDEPILDVFLTLLWGCTQLDLIVETGKQVANTVVYPVKAAISATKLALIQNKLNKLNKNLTIVNDILNLDNSLAKVGQSKSVSNKDFIQVTDVLTKILKPEYKSGMCEELKKGLTQSIDALYNNGLIGTQKCKIVNNGGYYGVMKGSRQISKTSRNVTDVTIDLVTLVCANKCL